jgi:hypothetical protein
MLMKFFLEELSAQKWLDSVTFLINSSLLFDITSAPGTGVHCANSWLGSSKRAAHLAKCGCEEREV